MRVTLVLSSFRISHSEKPLVRVTASGQATCASNTSAFKLPGKPLVQVTASGQHTCASNTFTFDLPDKPLGQATRASNNLFYFQSSGQATCVTSHSDKPIVRVTTLLLSSSGQSTARARNTSTCNLPDKPLLVRVTSHTDKPLVQATLLLSIFRTSHACE